MINYFTTPLNGWCDIPSLQTGQATTIEGGRCEICRGKFHSGHYHGRVPCPGGLDGIFTGHDPIWNEFKQLLSS